MLAVVTNATVRGFCLAKNTQEISHLQFVDDTLLFCDTEEERLRNNKLILLFFEAVSGLRVNFFKSELALGLMRIV